MQQHYSRTQCGRIRNNAGMAKDRGGSTHFFAALLVACGILSFGLLEWRLSKTLSHHPTRHEGDGPWLKPRVYHRRRR